MPDLVLAATTLHKPLVTGDLSVTASLTLALFSVALLAYL